MVLKSLQWAHRYAMPCRAWAADTVQPQGQCTKSPLPGYHLCDKGSGTLGAQGGDIKDWTELGGLGAGRREWGVGSWQCWL